MGATQSRQRDACTQTSPFECRKAIMEVPVGSCSTPVCPGPPVTIKIALNARTTQPPHKRRKYDPNSSPLKSQFEDKSISPQPIILHKKANNAASQIIADAVVGQYSFKGFPSKKILRRRMRSKKIVKRQDSSKGFEMNVQNNSTLPIFKFKLNKKVEFVDSVASTTLCNKETLTESESQQNKKVTSLESVALEPSICINSTLMDFESQQNKKVSSLESVAPKPSFCSYSNITEFESQEKENMTIAPGPSACSKSTQTLSESKQNKKLNSVARGPLICIRPTLVVSESQLNKEVTFVDSLGPAESLLNNSNLTEFESQEKENMTIAGPITLEQSLRSKSTESESKLNKMLKEYERQVKNECKDRSRCTEHIPLHRRADNATLQVMADAVVGLQTLRGFPSNKVLRKKKRSMKTVKRQDSSDEFEMNIQRNKKVTFVDYESQQFKKVSFADSVAPAQSIRRNTNLTKYESPVKKNMTISNPIAPVASILKSPILSKSKSERNKKFKFVYSAAPSSPIRTNSNLTKYGSRSNTEFEDKSICIPHITLPRKKDAALQIIANAVVGQPTIKGFLSSKVLRKRMHSKKTVTRQDSSDDEININKKVTFMDSLRPSASILRNSNLTEFESQEKENMTIACPIAVEPSLHSKSTESESKLIKKLKEYERQVKKDMTIVDPIAPVPLIRRNSILKKTKSERNKYMTLEDSVAPASSIRKNYNLAEYESQQTKEMSCVDSVAPSSSIRRISHLTKYESQVKTGFEDKSICTKYKALAEKKDNAALHIMTDAMNGQHILKRYPSNKVLKKRMSCKKTETCQDSSDDFEINIKRNKRVTYESQGNKTLEFVNSVGPALLTVRHSTLSKSVNNRNQKVWLENSTAPANTIRRNWTLPKYEIQHQKRVTFADPIASSIATRRNSTLPKYEIQRNKKVTFADSVASAPTIRSRSTFTKSENSRTKMVAYADSIAPVKFILTNSPLPKYERQRNKRVTLADHILPAPVSCKDDTSENYDARKYYDLNISNEKLFTDTEEDDGKKLNPCEKRSSQLNYNSDSSGHSIPTVKLSYEMRKIYYYL